MNVYMYECVFVCMCVFMYVCMCVFAYLFMYACLYVNACICVICDGVHIENSATRAIIEFENWYCDPLISFYSTFLSLEFFCESM